MLPLELSGSPGSTARAATLTDVEPSSACVIIRGSRRAARNSEFRSRRAFVAGPSLLFAAEPTGNRATSRARAS
jgi:predicted ABC-type transport system involved in lysophospholipase L1 biosynthesis ATPase subunit